MLMALFQVGDVVRFWCVCKKKLDAGGEALENPTTLTLKLKPERGPAIKYVFPADAQIVNVSKGKFKAEIAMQFPGELFYRWIGTGEVAAATPDGSLTVEDTVIP